MEQELVDAIVDSGKFDWTKYPDKYPRSMCSLMTVIMALHMQKNLDRAGAFITKCYCPADEGLRLYTVTAECFST